MSLQPSQNLRTRIAVLDAVPGNLERPKRTAIRLVDGALVIAEADWSDGATRLLAGGWVYTKPEDRLDEMGTATSKGAYVRGERQLAAAADMTATAFFRLGIAEGDANPFSQFASAGVSGTAGDRWEWGAAVLHSRASDLNRKLDLLPSETVFELTVAHAATEWLTLQPDIQYILYSGEKPGLSDALALGLRVTIVP